MVKLKTGFKLKALHSDNSGEYLSTDMKPFMAKWRSVQRRMVLRNPPQNGIAERLNWTLLDHVHSMHYRKKLRREFWTKTLEVAVHVRILVMIKGNAELITTHKIVFGRNPSVSPLRAFELRCWYKLVNASPSKPCPKVCEAFLVGYSRDKTGSLLMRY